MIRTFRWLVAALMATGMVVLSGCGGGGDQKADGATASTRSSVAGASVTSTASPATPGVTYELRTTTILSNGITASLAIDGTEGAAAPGSITLQNNGSQVLTDPASVYWIDDLTGAKGTTPVEGMDSLLSGGGFTPGEGNVLGVTFPSSWSPLGTTICLQFGTEDYGCFDVDAKSSVYDGAKWGSSGMTAGR